MNDCCFMKTNFVSKKMKIHYFTANECQMKVLFFFCWFWMLKCLWKAFQSKEEWRFPFWISFFVLEIFTFLYYANEGSDDVIDRSTKTVQHLIKHNSGNIKAVFLKLATRNVHHKRNKMTPTMLLPWQHPWFQSLSVKNQISPFATFLSGTGGLPRNRHDSHIVLTLPIWLLGVDDPCVRWNLGILVVIKTGPAA